jgi:hypothetical protein
MEPTLDRRSERSERVPLRIEVELGQGDFQDAFPADSLNLSKGGISMRAPCLPDIGSRLLCRFQCLPSGTVVTAQGEVVWAHLDGERCGEFGLAFVDLDAGSEWLIEEMIAEHAAHSGQSPPADVGAPVATLELDGSDGSIAARLASADAGQAVFEQDLDLLRLGRGVRTHAPGADGRQGSISAVELRMVGSVPMLAVTVVFGETSGVAAAPAPAAREDDAQLGGNAGTSHDTEPDLNAPLQLLDAAEPARTDEPVIAELSAQETLPEFDVAADAEPSQSGALPVRRDAAPARHDMAPARHDLTPAHAAAPPRRLELPPLREEAAASRMAGPSAPREPVAQPSRESAEVAPAPRSREPVAQPSRESTEVAPAPRSRTIAPRPVHMPDDELDGRRDFSTSFALPGLGDEDPYYELEEKAEPEWKTLTVAALRALALQCAGLLAALRAAASATCVKVLPQVRVALLRSGGTLRGVYASQLAPRLGALRRFASLRRRRTTAGPGSARPSSSLGRTLVLGVLGAGVTALAVYALAPSGREQIELHRPVRAPETSAGAQTAAVNDALPVDAREPMATATAPAQGARAKGAPALPDPRQVPSAEQVPAGSPFAVDVRAGAGAKPGAAAQKLRFGAVQVPNARRFTLRMSGRVHALQGTADAGGFSVTVLGGLSLDRAGPISSSHKSVQRSMIINKGDRAELNIRFADGKRPAYQVSAEGNVLYVLIQEG